MSTPSSRRQVVTPVYGDREPPSSSRRRVVTPGYGDREPPPPHITGPKMPEFPHAFTDMDPDYRNTTVYKDNAYPPAPVFDPEQQKPSAPTFAPPRKQQQWASQRGSLNRSQPAPQQKSRADVRKEFVQKLGYGKSRFQPSPAPQQKSRADVEKEFVENLPYGADVATEFVKKFGYGESFFQPSPGYGPPMPEYDPNAPILTDEELDKIGWSPPSPPSVYSAAPALASGPPPNYPEALVAETKLLLLTAEKLQPTADGSVYELELRIRHPLGKGKDRKAITQSAFYEGLKLLEYRSLPKSPEKTLDEYFDDAEDVRRTTYENGANQIIRKQKDHLAAGRYKEFTAYGCIVGGAWEQMGVDQPQGRVSERRFKDRTIFKGPNSKIMFTRVLRHKWDKIRELFEESEAYEIEVEMINGQHFDDTTVSALSQIICILLECVQGGPNLYKAHEIGSLASVDVFWNPRLPHARDMELNDFVWGGPVFAPGRTLMMKIKLDGKRAQLYYCKNDRNAWLYRFDTDSYQKIAISGHTHPWDIMFDGEYEIKTNELHVFDVGYFNNRETPGNEFANLSHPERMVKATKYQHMLLLEGLGLSYTHKWESVTIPSNVSPEMCASTALQNFADTMRKIEGDDSGFIMRVQDKTAHAGKRQVGIADIFEVPDGTYRFRFRRSDSGYNLQLVESTEGNPISESDYEKLESANKHRFDSDGVVLSLSHLPYNTSPPTKNFINTLKIKPSDQCTVDCAVFPDSNGNVDRAFMDTEGDRQPEIPHSARPHKGELRDNQFYLSRPKTFTEVPFEVKAFQAGDALPGSVFEFAFSKDGNKTVLKKVQSRPEKFMRPNYERQVKAVAAQFVQPINCNIGDILTQAHLERTLQKVLKSLPRHWAIVLKNYKPSAYLRDFYSKDEPMTEVRVAACVPNWEKIDTTDFKVSDLMKEYSCVVALFKDGVTLETLDLNPVKVSVLANVPVNDNPMIPFGDQEKLHNYQFYILARSKLD